MTRLRTALLALALAPMCLPALANEVLEKGDFSITLPNGWVEIPRDELEEYSKAVSQQAPDAPPQHYAYGFQADGASRWLSYPYILIQEDESGRISPPVLDKLTSYSMDDIEKKTGDAMKPLIDSFETGSVYRDKEHNMLWMELSMQVSGVGQVKALTGFVPTQKGHIRAYGYSPKRTFDKDKQVFFSAFTSLTPSPALQYKPWAGNDASTTQAQPVRGTSSGWHFDWQSVGEKAFVGGLVGGLIAVTVTLLGRVLGRIRRRKGRE